MTASSTESRNRNAPPPSNGQVRYHEAGPPVRLNPVTALRRNWLLALAPVVLLVGVALFVGLTRPAVYTSQSRLAITRLDVSAPGALAGFAVATRSLASAYSRSVDADAVIVPVANELGLDPAEVAARVSASPIPESPVFYVQAFADSEPQAIALANATSDSLLAYIVKLNSSTEDSDRLYARFKRAALLYNKRLADKQAAARAFGEDDSEVNRSAFQRASAERDAVSLRRTALREAYQKSQQGQLSSDFVQTLSPATAAESDRISRLQLFVFVALVAGGVVGLALAVWQSNREARRELI